MLINLYKIIMLDFKAYCQMMVTDMRVIQRLRHLNYNCHHCLCQTYGLVLHSSVSSKLSFTLKDYLHSLVIYIFHLDIWRQTLFFCFVLFFVVVVVWWWGGICLCLFLPSFPFYLFLCLCVCSLCLLFMFKQRVWLYLDVSLGYAAGQQACRKCH